MDINYYKKYEPIDGKWYINRELGSGAFGTVFEIERRDFTNAKSALKVITIPASPSEVKSYREENFDLDEKSVSSYFYGFVEEFVKEFELMLQLKGKSNIVSIEDYDVKKHTDEVGWDIFIRMELLTPMNKHFAQNPPKTSDVIKLGIDICKALEVCEKYNIVHRDIKPSNIFVSQEGEFKLGDFGVARTLEKTSSGLSKKGTYTYMAPEVYRGDAYGSDVDIYSLGIVLYKLLNNNMEPFKLGRTHADEENALVARMKNTPMPKPANADGRLAEIVLKACALDPKDRYESPVQMREELESILYAENEGEIILPEEDRLKFEPTDAPVSEESETIGIFDEITKKEINEDDEPTRGIFDEGYYDEDATSGIFDEDVPKEVEETPPIEENPPEPSGGFSAEGSITALRKSNNIFKGIFKAIVAVVVVVALVFGGLTAYKTFYNPYNHMGYYNISGMTLAEVAELSDMTVEEAKRMLNLPEDVKGDTYYDVIEYLVPVSYTAEMYGVDVETLKQAFGLDESVTGDTLWGEAMDTIPLSRYCGGDELVSEFIAEYDLSDDVTGETLWGEVKKTVNKIEYERYLAEMATNATAIE